MMNGNEAKQVRDADEEALFASLQKKAAALGLVPVPLGKLGKRQGYIAMNDFPTNRDPFVKIGSVWLWRRGGRYRLVVRPLEPFFVDDPEFIVWVRSTDR